MKDRSNQTKIKQARRCCWLLLRCCSAEYASMGLEAAKRELNEFLGDVRAGFHLKTFTGSYERLQRDNLHANAPPGLEAATAEGVRNRIINDPVANAFSCGGDVVADRVRDVMRGALVQDLGSHVPRLLALAAKMHVSAQFCERLVHHLN